MGKIDISTYDKFLSNKVKLQEFLKGVFELQLTLMLEREQ